MISSNATMLALSLFVGMITGGVFFIGLWFTVQQLASAKRPAVLMLFSSLVRLAIVVAAFFLVGRGHLDRMMVCLSGFLIARFIIIKRLSILEPGKEATDAPQS